MKLTKEEKELILQKREEEKKAKPKKIGFLKEDLYFYGNLNLDIKLKSFTITESEKQNIIEEINSKFICVPKGTRFYAYLENQKEFWYNDYDYGIEYKDFEWAKQHLTDITDY